MATPYSISTPHGQFVSVYSTQSSPHSGGAVYRHGGFMTPTTLFKNAVTDSPRFGGRIPVTLNGDPVRMFPVVHGEPVRMFRVGGGAGRKRRHQPTYLRNVIRRRLM